MSLKYPHHIKWRFKRKQGRDIDGIYKCPICGADMVTYKETVKGGYLMSCKRELCPNNIIDNNLPRPRKVDAAFRNGKYFKGPLGI